MSLIRSLLAEAAVAEADSHDLPSHLSTAVAHYGELPDVTAAHVVVKAANVLRPVRSLYCTLECWLLKTWRSLAVPKSKERLACLLQLFSCPATLDFTSVSSLFRKFCLCYRDELPTWRTCDTGATEPG